MLILVINCGSSSAKYKLFHIESKKFLAKGVVERIGEKGGRCKSHYQAIGIIKDMLLFGKQALPRSIPKAPGLKPGDEGKVWGAERKSPAFRPGIERGLLRSIFQIDGIGHRVVHGGEEFKKAVVINKKTVKSIEQTGELAPLHNPPSLEGIKACKKFFPGIPQVAVFDTAFHQSMPDYAYIYGIPLGFYKKYKIRRYGFHGTSHRFVATEAARRLKKPLKALKLITVHLGNGCSMAAVLRGKSVDTTMGFTPLEGLLMGTRGGDIDPAIITFLMRKERLKVKGIEEILNKKSGLLGISGVSNDMRDILSRMKNGNRRAHLAFKIFVYRIKKYIGAYQAVMGGLDAVIFTGGIGENVPAIQRVLSKELRPTLGRKIKFLTIPTNEELLIAQDTYKLIK